MVSESWRQMKLGNFVTLQRGHDLPEPQRRVGTVPVIGSFGITGHHDVAVAKGPGVTVGRSGASFGVVTHSPVDYWPLNTALYAINFHGNDERFTYYLLKSLDFARFDSGSAQPSLNRNYIHPIPVLVPPPQEQRAIADILGTLDDKIELNRRMNETLEAMARAIFKSWFVDFDPVKRNAEVTRKKTESTAKSPSVHPPAFTLHPSIAALFPDCFQDSPLGKIPKGWATGTLGDICTVGIGGDWGSDFPSKGLIEVRCLRGVYLEHLRDSGWGDAPVRWIKETSLSKRLLNQCDVLVAASGLGPLGRSFWVADGFHECFEEPIIYSNFCKRLSSKISVSIWCGPY